MKLKPTSEQKRIIKHVSGHAMVQAGPGCAKTSTLALRTKSLIQNGCDPESIVIVTYTKALTLDIKATLTAHLGEEVVEQIIVKTLHSFALLLVREHYKQNNATFPTVLKRKRKRQLITRFSKKYKLKISELNQAFYYHSFGNAAKVEKRLGMDKAKLAKSAYKEYSKIKQKQNHLDFNDMISQALRLLKHDQSPSSILQSYRHLMVDELQDINRPQKDLLHAISQSMISTVMVGDNFQSIYGWRHALPRYWGDLAISLSPKQFALTTSFRIPKQALPLVNDIAKQIDKDALGLSSETDGECPELINLINQDAQHHWLAKEIKNLLAKGVDIQQIAILGRTRKELSQTAIALRTRGISITEHYMPTDVNYHREHLRALIQLTLLEKKRISKSSKQLNKDDLQLAKDYIEMLWIPQKTRQHLLDRLGQKPKALLSVDSDRKDYHRIHYLSKALEKAAQLARVESAIQCLIDASKPVLKDQDPQHHKLLLRDLSEIKVKAGHYENMSDIDARWFDLPERVKDEGVQMMTVHNAKGQEWDYVFLINVVHGVYPRNQNQNTKKEEIRVLYVAVTRHHKKLYLLQTPVPINVFDKKGKKSILLDKPSPLIDVAKQELTYK